MDFFSVLDVNILWVSSIYLNAESPGKIFQPPFLCPFLSLLKGTTCQYPALVKGLSKWCFLTVLLLNTVTTIQYLWIRMGAESHRGKQKRPY